MSSRSASRSSSACSPTAKFAWRCVNFPYPNSPLSTQQQALLCSKFSHRRKSSLKELKEDDGLKLLLSIAGSSWKWKELALGQILLLRVLKIPEVVFYSLDRGWEVDDDLAYVCRMRQIQCLPFIGGMLCLGMELIFMCDLYGRPTGEGQRVSIQGFAVNSRELRWCPTLVTGQTRRRGMCYQVVSWSFWYTTWRMLSFCWCTTGKGWTVMRSVFFLQGFCNQMDILVTLEREKHEICVYLRIIVACEKYYHLLLRWWGREVFLTFYMWS